MGSQVHVISRLCKLYDKQGNPLKAIVRIWEYLYLHFEDIEEERDNLANICCKLLQKLNK